jgi:ATP-dependent helicase Lhr and Lhr-like helicase
MSVFARFDPLLQEKIVHRLGWASLRPVQELASEAILDGKNCIVLAPTAGGKTEASMFPVLSGCLTNQEIGLRALYICPTRALLNNQEERLGEYASMLGLGAFKWHGDVTASSKKIFLRESNELLLTTPESLEVMLVSGKVPTARLFKHLKYVVIDEIHSLASCDRGNHLLSVLERIRAYCDNDFQRIGLSATVGNPGEILNWMQGSSQNEGTLVDPPKKASKKQIEIKFSREPGALINQIIDSAHGCKSLLFCESRRLVESISKGLKKWDEPIYVHHSSLSREEREESERQFHHGDEACIVCTSTMELGIDVGDLDKVLQINSPATVSSFLQRMGRTGRRANSIANMTFYVEKETLLLQSLAIVELAREGWVEDVGIKGKVWHILLHQIMAMCLERGAISAELVWNQLNRAFCFSGITSQEFDRFFNFLLLKGFLHDDGGTYSMGLEAEKAFGRKNFMELYSVFSSPLEFEVIGLSGDIIGNVQWSFLEKLLEQNSSFYLSGKPWSVERIEWKKKVVHVLPCTGGKIPQWGSINPSFLSYRLCRKMRDLIVSETDYPYLDPESKNLLQDLRDDQQQFLGAHYAPIEYDDKGMIWWTWAGGNINNTLRAVLMKELDAEVQARNESITVKGNYLHPEDYDIVIDRISNPAYWKDPEVRTWLLAGVPNYHLSKFQPYLPDQLKWQLIADSIYDIDATVKFLRLYKDN